MADLISVLIPSYNHERYVGDCLRSVMAQTYPDIELLLLDDGSSDGTWEAINALVPRLNARFARVVVLRRENGGVNTAMLRLRELSAGGYVFSMASDDVLKERALERLHGFLAENPEYCMAVGDNEIIDASSRRIGWDKERNAVAEGESACCRTFAEYYRRLRPDVDFSASFGGYASLLRGNYVPCGFLVRGDLYRNAPILDRGAPLEDWYQVLQFSKAGKMKFLDEVLFSYRWHEGNSVKNVARMREFTRQTLELEIANVLAGDDGERKRIVREFLADSDPEKDIVALGSLMRFYRKKGWRYKTYCLDVFGVRVAAWRRRRSGT